MAPNIAENPSSDISSPLLISPEKLRSDLYSYCYTNPEQESSTATPLVISVLASLIERNIARNERMDSLPVDINPAAAVLMIRKSKTSAFDSHEAPDLTIQSYLQRIFRYTRVGPSVYVVAYAYLDRLCQKHQWFKITEANVHRLLITTIMVASKYVEDMNYRNSYFAKVGGLSAKELNKLEIHFLFLMEFKLHVNVSVFQSYCSHLEREVSIGGGHQIERTIRCAEEIKSSQSCQSSYYQQQTPRVAL